MGPLKTVVAMLVLATACQPLDEPSAGDAAAGTEGPAMAQTLPALLEQAEETAAEWQDDPRLVQVAVDIDPQGRWTSAQLDYVAAGADRLLSLFVGDNGLRQEQVTFATLGLAPIPASGIAELPPFPDDALGPIELLEAARPALDACGVEPPAIADVLYATGAPATWNGERWTQPPAWHTVLSAPEGDHSVVVDPTTGATTASSPC